MTEKELLYKYLVVICREGITEVVPFENETTPEFVEKYFDRVSEQWSDAYLCKILKGPIKIQQQKEARVRGNFHRNDPQWKRDRGTVLYKIAPIVFLLILIFAIFCDK